MIVPVSAIDGSLRLRHELYFYLFSLSLSVAQQRVRPPVAEWDMNVYLKLTGVVSYCGITLILFTTDQTNTVYK